MSFPEQAPNEQAKLKQERDEAVAQVEVMRKFARHRNDENGMCERLKHSNYECTCGYEDAMNITPSAALREIQARALEDAKEEFYGYKNHTSDEMFVDTAIELLDNLAAAKRKGE